MKTSLFLLSALLVLTNCTSAKPDLQPSPHDLVFDQLASSWDEGMPLGNGIMGALVWEKDGRLRIALDRADLWDLRPTANVYKEGINYQWVRKNWEERTYKKVHKALDEYYDKAAGPSKIPVAALELALDQLGPVESVRLYTHHGLCQIQWENGSSMEIFMDPEKSVGWFRLEGVDAAQDIKLVAPPYSRESEASKRNKVTGGQDVVRLGYPAGELQNGKTSLDYKQEGWNGFHYQVHCELDREEESITGRWSISAHYPDQEAQPSAAVYLEQVVQSSFEESREELLTWWDQYWSRSAVSLPDPVLEKQWYLEMYKFGAAARKGAPPISLQAVWTADNGLLPPWKGDFHHDLNTQLSYWPAYAGNQLELEEGFLDWLWSIREEGKKYTRWFYEAEGLNIPGVSTLNGVQMGGWSQYSYSPTVSAWLGHHFYLHWKYSQDQTFLRERAYPWIKDVAIFLDQIAMRDQDGKRKLLLSSSPEIFDNRREAWFEETTNYDLSLIRFTYWAASEMARELRLEEEAKQWNSILTQWPDMAVDPESGLMFAPGFPYHESHRHFSHLMAFHPMSLLDVSNGPIEQEIIGNTLRTLEKYGPDWWTGYSYSWMGNLYARALEGENAAKALHDFATCFTLPSSFHVNGDQSGTGKSKFTYRPFTLEGNFAFASGIHEMLLQSHTGIVRVFPAIPESWKDVSYRTLRTEGAFLISATRENGACTRVEITAEKGGTIRLADPFNDGSDREILEIKMEPGETRTLTKE
ncbi:MAG: glycoside hydrolase N-terminal domain-containing protein [Bacteroidales bacterium]|nr:glycoside hydrolase N-terminal domain-containing protein [Bacteroidales bacterium]